MRGVSWYIGDGSGLVEPGKKTDAKKDKDTRPGSSDKPIRIFASGNSLLITGDDPEAMALLQRLVNLYTKTPGKGDFTILKLKNGNAVDVAKALDEAYNGTRPANAAGRGGAAGGGRGGFGGPGGFFNPFAAPGAAAPTDPEADRIRVVAYPATNSILVRAKPLDMLGIRNLLATALDTEDTDSRALIKTHVIGPLKNSSATDIANILRDVYREQINQNPSTNSGSDVRPGSGGQRGCQFPGTGKTVQLSIGVYDHTNSIIVSCPDPLYEDVNKLVEKLDDSAKLSPRTVQVVSIKGIDPSYVQMAIDAVQGRTTVRGPNMPGVNSALGGLPFGINTPFGGAAGRPGGGGGFPGGGGGGFPGGGGGFPGGGGGFPGGGGGGFRPGGGGGMPGGGGGFPGGGGAAPGGGGRGPQEGVEEAVAELAEEWAIFASQDKGRIFLSKRSWMTRSRTSTIRSLTLLRPS